MKTKKFKFGLSRFLAGHDRREKPINNTRKALAFIITLILLVVVFFIAATSGSINVGFGKLLRGLFVEIDQDVVAIWDLRFPRIVISILAGAAISVSGVLLQAVMKNPLTDPGIIGISSAASLMSVLVITMFPALYFSIPLFSVVGGLLAYLFIYSLA